MLKAHCENKKCDFSEPIPAKSIKRFKHIFQNLDDKRDFLYFVKRLCPKCKSEIIDGMLTNKNVDIEYEVSTKEDFKTKESVAPAMPYKDTIDKKGVDEIKYDSPKEL